MIPLTERLLADAGGWQVMKQARSLHEMRRIAAAAYEPPILQGRVREGETEYRAGLRILSKSNIENLCSCRVSRQLGAICAHSLAVGLEVLQPQPPTSPPAGVVSVKNGDAPAARPIFTDLENGTPIELFVVLAPNFISGWDAQAVTVGVEAADGSRRVLVDALDKTRTYRCSSGDLRVIEQIRVLNAGALFGMARLPRESFLALLGALPGHPRVSFGKKGNVQVQQGAVLPRLTILRDGEEGSLTVRASLAADAQVLMAGSHVWQLAGSIFTPVSPGLPAAYHAVLCDKVTIPATRSADFLHREVATLRNFFDIEMSPDLEAGSSVVVEFPPPAIFLKLEGSLKFLAADLEWSRDGQHRGITSSEPADRVVRAAIDRLRSCGFSGPDHRGQLALKGEGPILSFFAKDLPELQRAWTVSIGSRFEHVTAGIERVEPRIEVRSSGENWFEMNVELATPAGERFSAAEIQRLLQSGRNSARLRSGKLAVFNSDLLDDFQQVLTDCNPKQPQPGLYRMDQRHAAYVSSVAAEHGLTVKATPEWRTWADTPRQLDSLRPIPLGELDGVLRPYQKQGVYWLNFLAQNGLGGILADEMGLGKTVQALAFLRTLKGQSLVVCPSSLIWNWEREAARFTPDRKVLTIEGPDRRQLFGQIASADLILTSYPLLRRDWERYRDVKFAAAVLDEAQHIRNPESQNAQSALKLQARHRFVLTGTPIENSVRDLWSIMNFALPGYLGSKEEFKERYERAIQQSPNGPEQRRLIQRLRLVVLRRSKRAVAPELPEKVEQVAYCKLTTQQAETYQSLLVAARQQLSECAGAKDQNKGRMLVLTALLRLRQVCCDLRLLPADLGQSDSNSSKLELLDELLEQAVDGGHRVLVFSQFVGMLRLISEHLRGIDVPFCYLDGATKDRQSVVDRFQTGEVPVFLISLKAGGVGLNLTAADTVVHFDPWWNPAVEAQATDRAHRIGQKKVVTVYKLVCRDTVEEKIVALQEKKRGLMKAMVESEQPLMDGLSMEDIESLLG